MIAANRHKELIYEPEAIVRLWVYTLILVGFCIPCLAAAQTLAATPPMGWNSWNFYRGTVDDRAVRTTADLLVTTGMRDAGYVYVNIDDTWEGSRDARGNIQTNKKFPNMKALADYVHGKGLKLGIYSSPGPKTCAGYEGSFGHEDQDATTYATWGIDYLKYDLCSFSKIMQSQAPDDIPKQYEIMKGAYEKMHQALLKTGRPIVYSLCQYGWGAVWEWGPSVGANLWRTTGDISASFDRMQLIGFGQAGLAKFAGPGHWNDPDMLEIGNGKLSHEENVFHMTLWAMLSAPLLAGNNLEQMSPETLAVLTNREAIAIDQDPSGHQAERVLAEGPVEVWARLLKDGATALAIFNTSDHPLRVPAGFSLKTIGLPQGARARDLWKHKDLGKLAPTYSPQLEGHGVVFLLLRH